jgi:N-succinyl-L-ornithine transcarbamylase
MVTAEKMKLTNEAKFMHCLPIRRNIVADDHVLDHHNSLVIEQANNRTYAAQWVLKQLLKNG